MDVPHLNSRLDVSVSPSDLLPLGSALGWSEETQREREKAGSVNFGTATSLNDGTLKTVNSFRASAENRPAPAESETNTNGLSSEDPRSAGQSRAQPSSVVVEAVIE